jgi:hypothetical protein
MRLWRWPRLRSGFNVAEPLELGAGDQNKTQSNLRFRASAVAASGIEAKSFTIDGEARVSGPDGLSRFDDLSRSEGARTAVLYAFDIIEWDGEDFRGRLFFAPKTALARLLGGTETGILLNEHIAGDGPTCSSTFVGLAPRASLGAI